MPQYHVDSEQLQTSSAAVNQSIEQMRTAVQAMYANLSQLQGSWQGAAAQQFDTIMTQWRSAQQNMEQTLQSIQQSLSMAAHVYADAENQASSLFTH